MHNSSFSHFVSLLAIVVLLFPPATTPLAQTKPLEPNPRQILDRGVAAMGGKEKLKAITSRQVFGTIKRLHDGAVGRYELLTQYPVQFYYRISFGQEFEQAAFSGITGYGMTSETPIKYFNDEDANLIFAEANYRNGYWYHDERQRLSGGAKAAIAVLTAGISLFAKFDSVKFEGEERTNGRVLQGVRFNLDDVATDVRAYFDQATGHLAREEMAFGNLLEIYTYDDYRVVNGVLEPHLLHLKRGADEYEIKVEQIIHNQPLEFARFETPAGLHNKLPALADILTKTRANQETLLRNYDQFTYERVFDFTDQTCTEDSMGNSSCESFDRQQIFDVLFHRGYPLLVITADDHKNINFSLGRALFGRLLDPAEAREKRIREGKQRIDLLLKQNPQRASEGLQKLDAGWGRNIAAVLRHAQFSNLRPTTHNQRPAYAVDFMPAPEGNYGKEGFVKQIAGVLYIDAEDYFVAQMETWETTRIAGRRVPMLDNWSTRRTQTRICPALWLPTEVAAPLPFKFFGGESFNKITYRNYRLNGQPLNCNAPMAWPK